MAFTGSVMRYHMGPPDFRSRELEFELGQKNPDGPPKRRPGDSYTVVGLLLGLLVGVIVGLNSHNLLLFIGFTLGGGILGAVLGSYVQPLINRLRSRQKKNPEEQQGPFR